MQQCCRAPRFWGPHRGEIEDLESLTPFFHEERGPSRFLFAGPPGTLIRHWDVYKIFKGGTKSVQNYETNFKTIGQSDSPDDTAES